MKESLVSFTKSFYITIMLFKEFFNWVKLIIYKNHKFELIKISLFTVCTAHYTEIIKLSYIELLWKQRKVLYTLVLSHKHTITKTALIYLKLLVRLSQCCLISKYQMTLYNILIHIWQSISFNLECREE